MQTVKNKFKNIMNEHLRSIYKDTNFILSQQQPKNLHRELTCSRLYQVLKTLEKQELINAVTKDAKYVNIT